MGIIEKIKKSKDIIMSSSKINTTKSENPIITVEREKMNPTITIEKEKKTPEIKIEVVKENNDINAYMDGIALKEVYSGGEYISGLKASDGFGPEFYNRVVEIANEHGFTAEELLMIINLESTFKPDSKNGTHLGFMQMDNDCFKEAGYTKEEYLSMNNIEKLDVINAHLYNLDRKSGNDKEHARIENYYAANLLPVNAKKEVVINKANRPNSYEKNEGLDSNQDGKITKIELREMLESKRVDISSFLD